MTVRLPSASALGLSFLALAACGGGGDDVEAASEAQGAEASAPATPGAAPEPDMLPAPEGSMAGGEMAIGNPDAPVTMTEFASVTCPGCAAFHASAFPAIKEQLIDTGQLRMIYKEFPTPPIRLSQAGFIVARCSATDAGPEAYFAMVDALYKTQRTWIYSDNPGEALRDIAAQAGIAGEEFDDCFRREDIRDAIIASIETGRDLGLTGTPSFVIDGQKVELRGSPEEIIETLRAEIEKRS